MATFIWTLFAITAMIGIFAVCVVIVAIGTRMLEGALARHRAKTAA